MTRVVNNPLTGRPIKIGGIVFNQLVFDAYDFINGELVRRGSAPPIPPRQYYYNTVTSRRILAGSRRYHELINANWEIEEDYYLIPPSHQEVIQHIPETTYEQIMATHRDTLANLNITLCKECFHPIKLEDGDCCDSCK
jgi:hypothetical protein